MEAVILTQTFTGWVPQCYRITSCKLIQYKQKYTTLDSISAKNASQIQQQHDINNMSITAQINRSNESILQLVLQVKIYLLSILASVTWNNLPLAILSGHNHPLEWWFDGEDKLVAIPRGCKISADGVKGSGCRLPGGTLQKTDIS